METLKKIWQSLRLGNFRPEKAQTIQQIVLFGFADTKPGDKLYEEAYRVAYLLAKVGYTIVDGGGPGVMEAASRGGKAGGGKVVAVTLNPKYAPDHFEGKSVRNPADVEIQTDNYVERTVTLLKEGQVYVIFNGASGTMSEFAMAWGMARIYFGHHKPLILYGKFWHNIMKALRNNLLVRPEELKVYKIVTTPQEVLAAIKEFEKIIEKGEHKHLKATKETGGFTI